MQNNININIDGLLTHIYKTNNLIENNVTNNEINNVTKIKKYDFFAKNEISINNILHLTENKRNRYITINNARKLQINDNKKTITKINQENAYIMIKYSENDGEYIEGITRFLSNKRESEYIYGVIESYLYLIKTFHEFKKEGIIYFSFSSEKMKFKTIYNPHCIIYDFETSLLENKLKGDKNDIIGYFCNFIKKINDFTFKPFEVHVLFYLYRMEEEYLSKYKITNIINTFVENMENILKEEDMSMIKENCEQNMNQFINKNRNDVIINLIQHFNTWDNYSVSILYLHLVENIILGYKKQIRFMSKFQDILYKNISPNPQHRLSIEETIQQFQELFQYWHN